MCQCVYREQLLIFRSLLSFKWNTNDTVIRL